MASPPWTGSSLSHSSGITFYRLPGKPPKLASEHPRMRGVVVSDTLLLVARVIRRIPTIIAPDRNPVVHIGSGQFEVHASAYFLDGCLCQIHVTDYGTVIRGHHGYTWKASNCDI